ncbi:MAG: DUF4348 domain-containing protein [Bacteroides sp.]|nr:DUF4348 domain-containing protein [Bacteroides sp.]
MKRLLYGIYTLLFLVACGVPKQKSAPITTSTTEQEDSLIEFSDSLGIYLEEPGLPEVDRLFDDFIFAFASDEALQKKRINFPLSFNDKGKKRQIQESAWKHDSLFIQQSYYTLLFDNEQEMDLIADTLISSVQVEWLSLADREIKSYDFERKEGRWMLEDITLRKMRKGDGEDFLSFYTRFVTDSLYQSKHICNPLRFVTIDPDDEFSILETTLDLNQWYAFRPMLPVGYLSNICYGQRNEDNARRKILKVNGIGNGYSIIFYFRKRAGEWELYKYEDTGV